MHHSARRNPDHFYVGLDANVRPLERISEKIYRNHSKGGLPNALFIQAAIEDLPRELDGIAGEVRVHFPWGSLLKGVATGDISTLQTLRQVCSLGARLAVIIGLDPDRDRAEVRRLGIAPFSVECIDSTLTPLYRKSGFEVVDRGVLREAEWSRLETSWAKRLRGDGSRPVFYIFARAIENET